MGLVNAIYRQLNGVFSIQDVERLRFEGKGLHSAHTDLEPFRSADADGGPFEYDATGGVADQDGIDEVGEVDDGDVDETVAVDDILGILTGHALAYLAGRRRPDHRLYLWDDGQDRVPRGSQHKTDGCVDQRGRQRVLHLLKQQQQQQQIHQVCILESLFPLSSKQ